MRKPAPARKARPESTRCLVQHSRAHQPQHRSECGRAEAAFTAQDPARTPAPAGSTLFSGHQLEGRVLWQVPVPPRRRPCERGVVSPARHDRRGGLDLAVAELMLAVLPLRGRTARVPLVPAELTSAVCTSVGSSSKPLEAR
jgi:hypothetical protein